MRKTLVGLAAVAMLAAPSALAQQRGTGLVWLEPERYRSIPLAPPVALTGVPAAVDMSSDFPTPGDQGQQGSCVGWAVGYALKSFQERRERNWQNWDDTKRMSPSFVYNQVKVGGCGDGARIADALGLLSSDGSAAWADQPYRLEDCNQLPSALAKQNAAMNRIAGWFRVNPQDITVVKAHLAAGMPIVIGMGVDQAFKQLESGDVYRGAPGSNADGHAMVVVGYSDTRNAVKVINSWGTGWGDGGFGWLDYEAFKRAVREAYVAQDVVLPAGIAERKEHPYSVRENSATTEFFGATLGMTLAETEGSLTRGYQKIAGGDANNSWVQFYVPSPKYDSQIIGTLKRIRYVVDGRYDYLRTIELHFEGAVSIPEFDDLMPNLSTAIVRDGSVPQGKRWITESRAGALAARSVLPESMSLSSTLRFADGLIFEALERVGWNNFSASGSDEASSVATLVEGCCKYEAVVSRDFGGYEVQVITETSFNYGINGQILTWFKRGNQEECAQALGQVCALNNLFRALPTTEVRIVISAKRLSNDVFD